MKQGWEIKKLGEVCKVIAGQSPEGKFYNSEGNGMPFYQGKKEYKEKYIGEPTTWTTKITKEAEAGDILMSVRAPVGPVNFATQKICIGRGLAAIRAGKNIDKEFLFNYLIKHESEIEGNAGAVFNSINKTQIENLAIPVPPLPEQQRIVSILDEAFAAITKAKANAEQNLKNAKELFESYLQGVFEKKGDGWEEKKLGEVCNVIGGGTPSKANSKFYDGDIFWATVRDMKGEVISDTEHKITKEAVKNSSTNIIPKGNVVIATRVGLGKVCLIENDTAINQDLRGVVPINSKKLLVDFLYHWFKSIAHKIVEEGTGATVQVVKLPFIKSLSIPLPPLKEQQTIVRQLDALRAETQKLEAVYQKKIADLEELKKSILQKAFAGELKVSELGFDGLKDERIIDNKKEILQSSNPKIHNSDKKVKI
jgi:type I restriction enzyme S subunit